MRQREERKVIRMVWSSESAYVFACAAGWGIGLIAFLVLEALIPGLVTIWFALGALAAMIAAMLGASLGVQIVVFILVSVVSLILTRPLAKRINSKVKPTNADIIIGREAIVTEDINSVAGTGRVKVYGKDWAARPADDAMVIPANEVVRVLRIEGVKVIVEPIFNHKTWEYI